MCFGEYEDELPTSDFSKANKEDAQKYIRQIEKRLGYKLNFETLKIEKSEFKDGDVVTIMPHIGDKLIYLFKAEDDEKYYGHAFLDGNIAIVNEDSYCQKDFCTARSSTEEEKQQLFEALAKKGKAWDAEKKQIVDLKPKCEFKPFDKVLGRNEKGDVWEAELFSHYKEKSRYPFVVSDLVVSIVFLTTKRQHIYQERLMSGKEVRDERIMQLLLQIFFCSKRPKQNEEDVILCSSFTQNNDNEENIWEQRRYEIAKDVAAGLVQRPNSTYDSVVNSAIKIADKLIERLKEK